MLKKNITLNKCLDVLNSMVPNCYDYSIKDKEVLYMYVSIEQKNKLYEILQDKEVDLYIEGCIDCYSDGFDISMIWIEISFMFGVDVRFDVERMEFYV